jgi:hypothetical protein
MSTRATVQVTASAQRVLLAILGVSAALVGGWAAFGPRSFYDSFPGAGHHWVSADGPYNEHLVRDVGALYLALLVLSIWAFLRPELSRLAGACWLIFSLPHIVYHARHTQMFGAADKVEELASLGATALFAALLVLIPSRPAPSTEGNA